MAIRREHLSLISRLRKLEDRAARGLLSLLVEGRTEVRERIRALPAGSVSAAVFNQIDASIGDAILRVQFGLVGRFQEDAAGAVRIGVELAEVGTGGAGIFSLPPDTLNALSLWQADLVQDVSDELRRGITRAVKVGMIAGTPTEQIAREIAAAGLPPKGPFRTAEARAEAIARTEINRVASVATWERGLQLVETLPGLRKEWLCVPAGTPVWLPGVERASARPYSGNLITLHTRRPAGRLGRAGVADSSLTVTPDHPVLTLRGWIPAKDVQKGDHLIRHLFHEGNRLGDPDIQDIPATAVQVFDAATVSRPTQRMMRGVVNFDSETTSSYVDVVDVASDLAARCDPPRLQPGAEFLFSLSDARLGLLSSDCTIDQPFFGQSNPGSRCRSFGMSGRTGSRAHGLASLRVGASSRRGAALAQDAQDCRLSAPITLSQDHTTVARQVVRNNPICGQVITADNQHSEGLRPSGLGEGLWSLEAAASGFSGRQNGPAFAQSAADGFRARPDGGGDFLGGLSGLVAADEITDIEINTAHESIVYDFQTRVHWFLASGYIVHNSAADERVRPSHAALNGVQKAPEEPFSVGGHRGQYPHDPALPAGEVARCRCRLIWRPGEE